MSIGHTRTILFCEERNSQVVIFGGLILELLLIIWAVREMPILWVAVGLAPIAIFVFYSIRVVIDDACLYIRYGIGLLSYEYDLNTIQTVVIGPNTSLLAWMFDPLSVEALIITFRDGIKIVIGSQERAKILTLLRARIGDPTI